MSQWYNLGCCQTSSAILCEVPGKTQTTSLIDDIESKSFNVSVEINSDEILTHGILTIYRNTKDIKSKNNPHYHMVQFSHK